MIALALVALWAIEADQPSLSDLDFLIGDWRVERIYEPQTERERTLKGTLACGPSIEAQFVRCAYHFEREDAPPIHDVVYFNHNPIYGQYEAVWLSATWPIKVTMVSIPPMNAEDMLWRSSFPIENGVIETVESRWRVGSRRFSRQTRIHLSSDEDHWRDWMVERVYRASE